MIKKAIREYLAEIGRKGGRKTSERKTAACRKNARRPRRAKKGGTEAPQNQEAAVEAITQPMPHNH